MIYHLGVLHFLPTFSAAIYYFSVRVTEDRWALAIIGFCLIMFSGVFIDVDHYLGKKAKARRREIWQGLKQGKITLGKLDPAKVNFFHSLPGFFLLTFTGIVIMQADQLLGACCLLINWLHILGIDPLDCDNQRVPLVSPLPTGIHIFLWNYFLWFRKICFNKEILAHLK
ncbi:MAG TPA: hypothetical protein PLK76_01335 [bacterium]|nr:hypothetical protein [bacterium]